MRYRADDHLSDLTDFQRRSVDHVAHEFFERGARRFLVADETGLGKTRVARGVIARTIEKLQDEPTVQRIDIVYVCSNADLARQNLGRLNVTGQRISSDAGRLTLLAKTVKDLASVSDGGKKPINLISFTPGTSFDMGYGEGTAQERALLYVILSRELDLDGWQRRALARIFQGRVATAERFQDSYVAAMEADLGDDGPEASIVEAFMAGLRETDDEGSYEGGLLGLIDDIGRRSLLDDDLRNRAWGMVRALRSLLAKAGVEALEPDLIILDEFQRFRHLLAEDTPQGELAHYLFDYPAARVLLLSATPYKPFTYAEEAQESHAAALFETLGFLAKGREGGNTETIRGYLRDYRDAVESGCVDPELRNALRTEMLSLMSRAERPLLDGGTMLREVIHDDVTVTADEIAGYSRLRDVARAIAGPRDRGLVNVDYWKSAPYFSSFAAGYQFDTRLTSALNDPQRANDVAPKAAALQRLDARAIRAFEPLASGNAKLRRLAADTLDQGWWKLLWTPPSLPYLVPDGVYAEAGASNVTKRLIFSSWTATPSALASLLSYEAERRIAEETTYTVYTPEARRRITRHFQYSLDGQRPASMSTLMIFWPMAGIANLGDPLRRVASVGGGRVRPEALAHRVMDILPRAGVGTEHQAPTVWSECFADETNWPSGLDEAAITAALAGSALAGSGEDADDDESPRPDPQGLRAHVDRARTALAFTAGDTPEERRMDLARIACLAPGNIAWRVLRRWADDDVTPDGLFVAAATLANGLRSLFNRPDATKLIEKLYPNLEHWRAVLSYCAAGNLEAVLDEYLAHVVANRPRVAMDADEWLLDIARQAASVLSLRMAAYPASTHGLDGEDTLRFTPRWALRYSGRQESDENRRQPEVREAFNSPFWPFVLVSTSVGQEGIDFHQWCHAVVHWNLPSNPVDFEQREGRVDRFRGHAVRKNVATAHGARALAEHRPGSVWPHLYDAARELRAEYGDFTPGWVYPGDAKIERHIMPVKFTRDRDDYAALQRNVRAYRLTFGQPRQEDMLAVMRANGVDETALAREMRIDLMP